jgi:hypothetical protein
MQTLLVKKGGAETVTDRKAFLAEGTGISINPVEAALLFNILHLDEPTTLMREAWEKKDPGRTRTDNILFFYLLTKASSS